MSSKQTIRQQFDNAIKLLNESIHEYQSKKDTASNEEISNMTDKVTKTLYKVEFLVNLIIKQHYWGIKRKNLLQYMAGEIESMIDWDNLESEIEDKVKEYIKKKGVVGFIVSLWKKNSGNEVTDSVDNELERDISDNEITNLDKYIRLKFIGLVIYIETTIDLRAYVNFVFKNSKKNS